ncbi:MAG: glycosyltransferase [Planctomycetaceae bacterium]
MTAVTAQPEIRDADAKSTQLGTVCHVVHSLGVGGAEVLVADMIRSLSNQFRCVVACLDDIGSIGDSLIAEGVPLKLLNRSPGIDWQCGRRLAAWCEEQDVDVMHVHQCTPMFQAMLSRLPGKRVPLLLTEHGRHHPDFPSRKRAIVHRLLLGKRDRLVAVGEATRQALIAYEGLPADRVEVIYNGVDLEQFTKVASEIRDEVRNELGLNADDWIVTLVARLDAIKDHPTAIRTVQLVRESVPNAKLLIVGDGPERDRIERIIRESNLQDCVRMLGTRRDVPRLLRTSDTFLMSSIGEGIPLTIIEAMAAGVPVVSTNVGGIPEMVSTGESGFLHESGDAEGLAGSIRALAGDAQLRNRVTEAARTRAFDVFSRKQMLASYGQLYQEMLRGN